MNTRNLVTTLAIAALVAGCRKQADTATPAPASTVGPSPVAADVGQPDDEDTSASDAAEAQAVADAENRARERVEAQVDAGEALYDANCAKCHGKEGTGKKGKFPAVIGDAALPESPPKRARVRKDEFASGQDLLDFISDAMPPKKGSLSEEEYAAVTAFLISANGIELGDPVSVDNAADVDLIRDDGGEDDEEGE